MLDMVPPAYPLTGLRVLEHRVVAVNLVFRLEIVGVGGRPVAIQGRANIGVCCHCSLPRHGKGHAPGEVTCERTLGQTIKRKSLAFV